MRSSAILPFDLRRVGQRGITVLLLGLVVAWTSPAAPALAHVVAAPAQVQAGTPAEIGFLAEHGCYGTSTTGITVHVPPGVTQVRPEPAAGFRTSVDAGTVSWSGGQVPDATPATFTLRLTLPAQAGQSLYFPVTQTCQQGQIEWQQVPAPSQDPDDLDTPAAKVELTSGPPSMTATGEGNHVLGAEARQNLPAGGVAAGGGGTSRHAGSGMRTLLALLLPPLVAWAATLSGGRRRCDGIDLRASGT